MIGNVPSEYFCVWICLLNKMGLSKVTPFPRRLQTRAVLTPLFSQCMHVLYTQSQKKCTMESCVSFAEEFRWTYCNIFHFAYPLGDTAKLKNTSGFNTMPSWPKEMNHFEKIPNLHCSQWNLSSFTNFKTQHTLGLLKISEEPLDIFEWKKYNPAGVTWPWPRVTGGSQWIYGAFPLRLSVNWTHIRLKWTLMFL